MSSLSSSNASIPPSWLSENNYTTLRDVSFSSYLNTNEENYIRTLVTMTRNLNNHPSPKIVDDEEIEVFSADKYFNGGVDQEDHTKTTKYNHPEKTIISLSKLNLQPRTPSFYSESSWDSQSALVRRVRNSSRSKNNFRVKKLSLFSSCYCCNDKSVDIEEQDQLSNHGNRSFNNEFGRGISTRSVRTSFDTFDLPRFNKQSTDDSYTDDPFTFPVSNSVADTKNILEEDEERDRKSLEMFGLDKRPNMTSWEAVPSVVEKINTSGPHSGTYTYDTESDASSDLFEIDTLSCTSNTVVDPSRYEPSEVSVDWSVVTASVADFSDFEENRSIVTRGSEFMGPISRPRVKMPRSGGMFGGCRSQKAVRVAEDVYRSSVGKRKSGESLRHLKESF